MNEISIDRRSSCWSDRGEGGVWVATRPWEAIEILKLGERMVEYDEIEWLMVSPSAWVMFRMRMRELSCSVTMMAIAPWCFVIVVMYECFRYSLTDPTRTTLLLNTRSDVDFQGIQVHKLRNKSTLPLRRSSPLRCLSTLYLYPWNTQSRWTTHLRQSAFQSIVPHSLPRALFENYDQDLKQLITSLKGKLEGDVKQLKGGMYPFSVFCDHGADG